MFYFIIHLFREHLLSEHLLGSQVREATKENKASLIGNQIQFLVSGSS